MRRRRGKRIWGVIAILALAAMAALVAQSYIFVVREVYVMGDGDYVAEDVIRTARIRIGGSIFNVDGETAAARVNATGRLCLEDMEIRYPSTLILHVRERQPAAMTIYMSKLRILDAEGFVIEEREDAPDRDLLYINGLEILDARIGEPLRAASGQMDAYRTVVGEVLAQGAGGYISEIDLGDCADIRVMSRTGVEVKLGDEARMADKIAWMRSALADLQHRGEGGGALDVSSGTKADYSRAGA